MDVLRAQTPHADANDDVVTSRLIDTTTTTFDLLDYLDDFDESSLTSTQQLQQQHASPLQPHKQPAASVQAEANNSSDSISDNDNNDPSDYIDVTLPWDAIAREVARTDAHTDDLKDLTSTRSTHPLPLPPPRPVSPERDVWVVDIAALLVPSAGGTLERFHLRKWREIQQLHLLLAAPRFHATRLAGDDRALFERCYRAFPHVMVTKARLVSVLRSVLGIDDGVRRKLTRDETTLCRHLDAMQYAFERATSDGVASVNWRVLLAALRMFREPLLGMREHCAWLFSAFASSGFLELHDSVVVTTDDVTTILTHFVRSHVAARFVSERIRQATDMLPAASGSAARMTYRRFKALLAQLPMQALFARATPHTSVLDELASPVYRAVAFASRKREHDVRAIKRLRLLHATRGLRYCFWLWTQLACVRKRTRLLLTASATKLARVQRQWAFGKLKRHAIASIAAIEIQRTFRGFVGRCAGEQQWRLVQAVVRVQSAIRMRAHFAGFLRDLRRRHQRAVRIQRVYRGRCARVAVRQRLLAYYYSAMSALQAEREAFRASVRDAMAQRLQRCFRRFVHRKRVQQQRDAASERQTLEREMQSHAEHAERALQQHRLDVTAAFDKRRIEHEAARKQQQHAAAEKQKVLHLRRQRQWDAFKRMRDERNEQRKTQSGEAYERVRDDWRNQIDERARTRKQLVTHVLQLEAPTREYKALHQTLQRAVRERRKVLLARFKTAGVVVPAHELDERAQLEVIDDEEASARQQAEDDWRRAEAAFLDQLDDDEDARATTEHANDRLQRELSAVRVQSAFRMFAARQLLRRELRAVVVKDFDTATQQPVYRNIVTGATSTHKPFAFGTQDDLAFADQWVRLTDATTNDAFFYHPQRMTQQWDVPSDCRVCCACKTPTFATLWDARDDTFWCESCGRDVIVTAPPDCIVPYDGSRPGGC